MVIIRPFAAIFNHYHLRWGRRRYAAFNLGGDQPKSWFAHALKPGALKPGQLDSEVAQEIYNVYT
jgi:hypothetical protein